MKLEPRRMPRTKQTKRTKNKGGCRKGSQAVHLLLNQHEVHIAVALNIPEILRFRRVNAVFAASVKVKKLSMTYENAVLQQLSPGCLPGLTALPRYIYLPMIDGHQHDPRPGPNDSTNYLERGPSESGILFALRNLLGLSPSHTFQILGPDGKVIWARSGAKVWRLSGTEYRIRTAQLLAHSGDDQPLQTRVVSDLLTEKEYFAKLGNNRWGELHQEDLKGLISDSSLRNHISKWRTEFAAGGVHVLLQLNPPAVEGIVHHLASTMRIPEILRLRQVCVGFQASVQVKKITMEYSREVRALILQYLAVDEGFNLPDEIFLPIITVHNIWHLPRRALQELLSDRAAVANPRCMSVVLTNPTGSARVADEQPYPRGLDNLWYPPPTNNAPSGEEGVRSWVQRSQGIGMAQLLTEVGEQPVVLKCMRTRLLFWCDSCKKWDDHEENHPDHHRLIQLDHRRELCKVHNRGRRPWTSVHPHDSAWP